MATRRGKRGNGEGSIYQDADGRWRSVVDLGYREGRRCRKYLSGRTRNEVATKLRRILDEHEAGLEINTNGHAPTVEAWLNHWLDNIAVQKVRPSTLVGYRGYVRNRIIPTIGRHRIDKLRPEHLEHFYAQLTTEGLSPATIRQVHRITSRALKVAVQRGRIRHNVATLVELPPVIQHEIEPLTVAQARAVLATARGRRNAARWSVALAMGLRQGEALGLTWEAIDLDAGTITVRQALQRKPGGGLVMVPPKSRAGRRVIPMPAPLTEALRVQKVSQAAERLAAGPAWTDVGMVFATPFGKPVDPRNDYREWRQLLRDAGVPPARLHDARHTAATLLLTQGVPARVVMEILGHSQISLTLGTYTHVVPELARDAANRMGDALWG
jgi:integrase